MTSDRRGTARSRPKSGPVRARKVRSSARAREGSSRPARRRRQATSGLWGALSDLVGAFQPMALRRLGQEIDACVDGIPAELNEYGYDRYGFHPDTFRRTSLPGALLYRRYFRAETHDIERVPPGRVLLICNHAGQLPFDGMMLGTAMLLEATPPRIARAMAEYWVSQLPFVSTMAARMGSMVGTPENCIKMLEAGECVMVFPEGARGANKPYRQRYQLQPFGQGFMRLALESGAPIVPVGIVGAEEQQPGLANFREAARFVGLPSLPVTVTFPWLGPLGIALALPVKYRIYFGKPLHFEGDSGEEDDVIQRRVDVVKKALSDLLARGLRERSGVFS